MSFKSSLIFLVSCALWASSAFAGKEDWKGQFSIKISSGEEFGAAHTPERVQFLFMSAGKCIKLHKGSTINNVQLKQDVSLCTNQNVNEFSAQLQKIGMIASKQIVLGSTYSE